MAEVAARALLESGHSGASYELAATPALSQTEVAAILSEAIGRPVAVEVVDREAWRRKAEAASLSGYAMATLLAMFRYYEEFGLGGNGRVLGWLLGSEPVSLLEFARVYLGRPREPGLPQP